MKRSPLRRIKPLRQRRADGADVEREPKPWAKPTLRPLRFGTYAGTTGAAVHKSEPYRDAALLDMARGRPCLMLVPGICSHRVDTVVAAHSNLSIHGKAGARKAEDAYSVWSCATCHTWLDQGPAPAEVKAAAFMAGHSLQVLAWRTVAAAPDEPLRYRKAATRALEYLKATPA